MPSAFTNTFKTFVLLAFLGALFMGIGAIFGTGGLIIGAVLALAIVGGTYWFSDKLAVAAARAKPVSREEAPRLYEIVEDLARRDGIPMPRLYVSPEAQPNAFATAPGPNHAVAPAPRGHLQGPRPRDPPRRPPPGRAPRPHRGAPPRAGPPAGAVCG